MSKHSHVLAKAHADYRMAMKLTVAHRSVVDAVADERRYLREKLADPRNEIAARHWLLACSRLGLAMAMLDYLVEEIELSSRLGFVMAGGVS